MGAGFLRDAIGGQHFGSDCARAADQVEGVHQVRVGAIPLPVCDLAARAHQLVSSVSLILRATRGFVLRKVYNAGRLFRAPGFLVGRGPIIEITH